MRPSVRLAILTGSLVSLGIASWYAQRELVRAGLLGGPGKAVGPSPLVHELPASVAIELTEVANGFTKPLLVTHAGTGNDQLYFVEQVGRIWIAPSARPTERSLFLDLAAAIDTSEGERGLLGLAFDPRFRENRRFYVSLTARSPQGRVVRVMRYTELPGTLPIDPQTGQIVLEMDDPASNHNGGMLAFGPDGWLYIGTGDGGRAGDPWDHARNPRSLLGKMLRLDVRELPYRIPDGNPFRRGGGRPEVWALGLRNPWRYSFDRVTGELWIADVGQNAWEEIHVVDPRHGAGTHFGWKTMEGRHCFEPRSGCDPTGLDLPIWEYGHDVGCSITGGYVYRGKRLPELVGAYLFGDYCSGRIWALRREPAGLTVSTLLESGLAISSFGEDESGEIYVCDHLNGRVFRIDPPALNPTHSEPSALQAR